MGVKRRLWLYTEKLQYSHICFVSTCSLFSFCWAWFLGTPLVRLISSPMLLIMRLDSQHINRERFLYSDVNLMSTVADSKYPEIMWQVSATQNAKQKSPKFSALYCI